MDTPVLIAGGGPVGLSLACELGWRGVECMLVERRPFSEPKHPTANHLSRRTLETLRRWGIAEKVRLQGFPPDYGDDRVFLSHVGGWELCRIARPPSRELPVADYSPVNDLWCPKPYFDPFLEEMARSLPTVSLYDRCEVTAFEQDSNGVTVQLAGDGAPSSAIRARYLAGCDGARSPIREALGIQRRGFVAAEGGGLRSFYFSSPGLRELLPPGGTQYWVGGVGVGGGMLVAVDGRDRWRLHLIAHDGDPVELIRRFAGQPLPVEMLSDMVWAFSVAAAERYGDGRVFLAGDAAHQVTAYGGLGMNTGLGDAVDLGWKLAATLDGWAGPTLLDSYEIERRPVALRIARYQNLDISGEEPQPLGPPLFTFPPPPPELLDVGPEGDAARQVYGEAIAADRHREFSNDGVDLGVDYSGSPIVVDDGTPPVPEDDVEYVPSARPGRRAPHAWLGENSSTLDLLGRGFTLMRLGVDPPEAGKLAAAADSCSVPWREVTITDPAVRWLYDCSLVLVRPDGHVAWRSNNPPVDPTALLDIVRGA